MRKSSKSVAALVFLLIGAIFLVAGWKWYVSQEKFLSTSQTAKGEVIQLTTVERNKIGKNKKSALFPVVQFTTLEGQTHVFRSPAGSTPPAYEIGEIVDVVYNPLLPSDAQIMGFWNVWGGAVVCMALGGILVIVGVALAIRSWLAK